MTHGVTEPCSLCWGFGTSEGCEECCGTGRVPLVGFYQAHDDERRDDDLEDQMVDLVESIDRQDEERREAHLQQLREVLGTQVLLEGLDYVAVWGKDEHTRELGFDNYDDAHYFVMAAKRNGAAVAYVDERAVSSIDE